MNCPNCGGQLEDGAKFCTYCGTQMAQNTPVQPAPQQPAPQPVPQPAAYTAQNNIPTQNVQPPMKKKSNGGLIAVVVILVLVIAALLVYLFVFNDKKSDKDSSSKNESSVAAVESSSESATETTTTTAPPETQETTTTTTTADTEVTTTAPVVAAPEGELAEAVIGKWNAFAMTMNGEEILYSDLQEQVDNGEVDLDMNQVNMSFEFRADGTFTSYTYTTGNIDGSWSVSGNSIIIADPDGSNPIEEGNIVYDESTGVLSVVMTDTQTVDFQK